MLTKQDIKKLTDVFATREETYLRFDDLREDFSNLQSSVDSYAKKADSYFEEMLLLNRRIDRLEKWAQQIGEKVGVKLEF